jgi:hypothetical protein
MAAPAWQRQHQGQQEQQQDQEEEEEELRGQGLLNLLDGEEDQEMQGGSKTHSKQTGRRPQPQQQEQRAGTACRMHEESYVAPSAGAATGGAGGDGSVVEDLFRSPVTSDTDIEFVDIDSIEMPATQVKGWRG